MSINITIRPTVPPELGENPENFSVAGHPKCVKLLTKLGIMEGLLLNWTLPSHIQMNPVPKDSAIYIPSIIGGSGIIVLKLISNLSSEEAVTLIAEQVLQQLKAIEIFVSSFDPKPTGFQVHLLFVVTSPKIEGELVNRVIDLKNRVFRSFDFFKTIQAHVYYVTRKHENDKLDENQEQLFKSILNSCMVQQNGKYMSNVAVQALIKSTPEFTYLQLSDNLYNCNNSEDNHGFSLKNAEKVRETYLKFFKDTYQKIMFVPDLDSLGHQILDSTSKENGNFELQKIDGFLGEYVNFTECVLSKLKKPKGLLIRGFSKIHVDQVLGEPSPHDFEFDWILCSKNRIYGFEVGRTDNVIHPKRAIERKVNSVFGRIFPKFKFILISFLKNLQMSPEKIIQFSDKHFGFVIYFPNISKHSIVAFLKEKCSDAKNLMKFLSSMPAKILSQIFVMTTENDHFKSCFPNLYSFVAIGKTWSLELAALKVEELFECEREDLTISNLADAHSQKTIDQEIPGNDAMPEIQYLSGLLSFGFLATKFSFDSDPSSLGFEQKQKKIQSDLILSPQQKRILVENSRFMLIAGEPGCGKTSLLLARALEAAMDNEIEKIFYMVPRTKTKLREWLQSFVYRSNCDALKKKWCLLEPYQLGCSRLNESTLRKSILLVDEMYFSSGEELSDNDAAFLKQTRFIEVMPLFKQCWLAETTAGQLDKMHFNNFTLDTLPHLNVEVLNVLFRSSWHIGTFSTKLLHMKKAISQSSALAFGCNGASQYKVEHNSFRNHDDLIAKLTNEVNLREKFHQDRIAIVFTNSGREQNWRSSFFELEEFVNEVFVVTERLGYYEVPFTGIEVSSVVVIIDYLEKESTETSAFLCLLLLAASRAQFELHILIKETYTESLKTLFKLCDDGTEDSIILSARMGGPLKLRPNSSKEKTPNGKRLSLGRSTGNDLLSIAIIREDCNLLETITESFPAENVDLSQFFLTIGHPKPSQIMEIIKRYLGPLIAQILLTETGSRSCALHQNGLNISQLPGTILHCVFR